MTDMSVQDQPYEAGMGDYFALMKPRVMSLVIFTALVGLLVAPTPVHPFIGCLALLCIAVGLALIHILRCRRAVAARC